MKLAEAEALRLVSSHDHGVLATIHPTRGVDVVPVVYSVNDRYLGIPVDEVKPKSSSRLQRQRNLEVDPRASLLIESWDRHDWSKLWWVRAELSWKQDDAQGQVLGQQLADSFVQYEDQPFSTVLTFEIVRVSGWAASETATGPRTSELGGSSA